MSPARYPALRRLIPALLALPFATGLAHAQPKAGFDCAKAGTALEKAICASPEAAEADHAVAVSYQSLMNDLSPEDAAALRADQRDWLAIREAAFAGEGNRDTRLQQLIDDTEYRAGMLAWTSAAGGKDLIGTWRNAHGTVVVERQSPELFAVSINVVDQVAGRWLCVWEGGVAEASPLEGRAMVKGTPLQLKGLGARLVVTEPFCDGAPAVLGESAAGSYFRVGAPDEPAS